MEDRYGYYSSGGRSIRDEELDEEEVWAVVKDTKETSPKVRKSKDSSSIFSPRRLPTASRMIPRAHNPVNEAKVFQQSAPVNIPDWSKIYRKNSKKAWADDDDADDGGIINGEEEVEEEEDDDDDDDDCKVPPHEWIAKKLARSQISSFSVCEGAGRTLKGRDLSQVRNAVLTRTGFLE